MITFIVLAYNEEANIEAAIETVFRVARDTKLEAFEVLAVNDGSTDRTGEILARLSSQRPQIRILTHEVNRGLGASIRDGIANAVFERLMFVAGDNDMSFEMIRLLVRYREVADIVLAFPINTEQRTVWRNTLSVFYRLIHLVTFRVFVNYVNAPSVSRTSLIRSLPLYSQRFSIVAECTIKMLRSGCTFVEVPGFLQNPNRGKTRNTVSLKNFAEVVRSFIRLFVEIHVMERGRYNKTPRRVFIDFAGGTIAPPAFLLQEAEPSSDRAAPAGEARDAQV
jgi:glycosyltransferase involved in cell wall biosynthesis